MIYIIKVTLSGLWILALISCCMSWPTNNNYRKTYTYDNYALPLMDDENYGVSENRWEMAQEPTEYDLSDHLDYYNEPQQQKQQLMRNSDFDSELLSEAIADLFYHGNQEEPIWGKIIRQRPETELEELKQLGVGHKDGTVEKRGSASVTTTTTSSPPIKEKETPQMVTTTKSYLHKSKMSPIYHGQKEFPLLRPPNQPKAKESLAPVITQRSLASVKKPSPYDTLRKYISIEDALKKEAEKRTASKGNSRQVKRSFVADSDSLTGQLNKLKKTAS